MPALGSTGIRQLTIEEHQRIRTLYFDVQLLSIQIRAITGFILNQIRYIGHSESAVIQLRSGRPRGMTPE